MGFQKAVKHDAKLRLALCGPAGSGKTYSLLSVATELGGPIAYVDTEHGSASKYADLFHFDVIEPDTFDPRDLIKMIKEAIEAEYRVICIDSLSHYWMGKGGELDLVDGAAKRTQGNSFAAWKHVTPVHNELVDTIIGAQIHVLVSMRTKTEWVIEEDSRGKKFPRKIGMQPVMRDGIEFEFDVCGDLDQDNTLTISKSRCPDLAGKVINRPGKDMAIVLKKWLTGAPKPAVTVPPPPQPAAAPAPAPTAPYRATDSDIPASMGGAYMPPAGNSADAHVASMKERAQHPEWMAAMIQPFRDMREILGDAVYGEVLQRFGVDQPTDFTDRNIARACYIALGKAKIELAAKAAEVTA